jgi:mannitol/fructose-specific phosphotransferase system IIA component (Ntr-type)
MKLLELLSPSQIKIGLEAEDKEESFEELIDLLVRSGKITDRDAALDAIYAREEMRSTGIGKGVAIPHGKTESIRAICAAAGTSGKGIEFESIDGKPVHLVFLVLAEINNPGPHLQTLSEIATCLTVPGGYDRLIHARTPDDFLKSLGGLDQGEEL